MNKKHSKIATLLFSSLLAVGMLGFGSAEAAAPGKTYAVFNPYENVDWEAYGQYKANFHAHSTNSDGSNTVAAMVEDHYAKGFDIHALTDHDVLSPNWVEARNGVTAARRAEIEAGVGRNGRGMMGLDNTDEQSVTDHINSFFAPFNNASGATMASTIAAVEALGGITHLNHPGRYTGGSNSNDATSMAASNNPAQVQKYVSLFMAYPSCLGMEIVNKIDNESKSDRILWDNILKQTMPQGRFVWGFSNDDTHSINATGYSWNVMLMPELTQAATRLAMESGAFYAVSRVSRLDGINRTYPTGGEVRGDGSTATLYLLEQPTPRISKIEVDRANGSIRISGADYETVEWIADGVVIATGETLLLGEHEAAIGNYVRAQLKSKTGIAFTQPFSIGLEDNGKVELVRATPSASVQKLNGNKNELTLQIVEVYSDGTQQSIEKTLLIANNAAGVYEVGAYRVYVDTKGNTQVRECYLIH
ncbi:MAG: hypothetical protein FWD46_04935 [Cystobacterineae bacterium]|nr:hypothetical protein [Cystobacterineae bacterium]